MGLNWLFYSLHIFGDKLVWVDCHTMYAAQENQEFQCSEFSCEMHWTYLVVIVEKFKGELLDILLCIFPPSLSCHAGT